MKQVFQIAKKDLQTFLISPFSAAVIAIFLLLAAYFFLMFLGNFNLEIKKVLMQSATGSEKINLNQWVVENYYYTLALFNLILIPLIATKGVAEEKRSGTWNLMLSLPVSNFKIALGKYFGALCSVLILQGLAGLIPFILLFIASPEANLIIAGFFGLLLHTAALLSVAFAAAAFCSNSFTAGFIAFITVLVFYGFSMLAGELSPQFAENLNYFAPFYQLKFLLEGRISLSAIFYHLSLIITGILMLRSVVGIKRC